MSNQTIFDQRGQEVGTQVNVAGNMYTTDLPIQSAPAQAPTPPRSIAPNSPRPYQRFRRCDVGLFLL